MQNSSVVRQKGQICADLLAGNLGTSFYHYYYTTALQVENRLFQIPNLRYITSIPQFEIQGYKRSSPEVFHMKNLNGSVPIKSPDRRTVLDRILDIPSLEQVVPRLQPDLLHRVIQVCGLEDCGELVALATPEQLMRIFDLDLWRSAQPGMD